MVGGIDMTQEEKELLLKDICARFPYRIKCIVTKSRTEEGQEGDVGKIGWVCLEGVDCINDKKSFFSEFGNFKPYLFPLSSMTDKQKVEYNSLRDLVPTEQQCEVGNLLGDFEFVDNWRSIDYLNANHFDYRGLIKKGLAIDATGLNIY